MSNYAEKLDKVERTTGTADKVMKVFDYHRVLNFLVTVLIIILLLWIVRKIFKAPLKKFWNWLTNPIQGAVAEIKAEEKTGQDLATDTEELKSTVDSLYNLLYIYADDRNESIVLHQLNTFKNQADWEFAKAYFGKRECHEAPLGIVKNMHDLPGFLVCNLRKPNIEKARQILQSHGIQPGF